MNRFTQLRGVRSDYEEKFYTPNFELLQQALQKQQTSYDVTQEVTNKIPEHFKGDKEAAEQYRQEMQQQMQNVTDAYITNGIQGGNMARRQAMLNVSSAWQPGGKANNLEKNNTAIKEYEARLQSQVDSGFIMPDVKEAMMKNYVDTFQSYDGDNFTEFTGKDAAQHVEVQAKLSQAAQIFAASAESNTGVKVGNRTIRKVMGGQYYEVVNDQVEYKDESEIREFLKQTYAGDKQMQAFIAQQDELFGTGQEQIDGAIDAVSKAMSYERKSYQSQFIQNRNFLTPEMKARRAAQAEEDKRKLNKTRELALVDTGLKLDKAPSAEDDLDNARDIKERKLEEIRAKKQKALRAKTGWFAGSGTLHSWAASLTGNGAEWEEYMKAKSAIDEEYGAASKANEEFYDKMSTLSPGEMYEMYKSPEGRDLFPHMSIALDKTSPRSSGEQPDEYMARVKTNAELVRQEYNKATVLSDVPEVGSPEYKKVQESMIDNGALFNMQVVAMNGENGTSEITKLVDHLEEMGYGEFDFSKNEDVLRARNIVKTFLTQEGQMRAGQHFGEVSEAIPQGHLFRLPHAQDAEVSITLLSKDSYLEDHPLARQINNFGAALTNPHLNITQVVNEYTGEETQGFSSVLSYPSLRLNEAGEEVPYTEYYTAKPNIDLAGGQSRNNPEVYRVKLSEDGKQWVFAETEDVESLSPMGISLMNQGPAKTNKVSFDQIITYHNENLKKQSSYDRPN